MSVIKREKYNIDYLEIKGFNRNNMEHVFSTRLGWNQDDIFQSMSDILEISKEDIYRCKQVHGKEILIIENQDSREVLEVEADGLVTNRKNIGLSTYHADCTPMYFYDEKNEVIGVVHAGWKGSLLNIAAEMIKTMKLNYDSKVEDIIVGIGPAICGPCYEIKEDLSSEFEKVYGNMNQVIIYKEDKIYLDIRKVNEINLLNEGILKENIYNSQYCTSCNTDMLYSYRKENKTKNRMISGIILR